MLIDQAPVLGNRKKRDFLVFANTSMALALSAHTPWVQLNVCCYYILALELGCRYLANNYLDCYILEC